MRIVEVSVRNRVIIGLKILTRLNRFAMIEPSMRMTKDGSMIFRESEIIELKEFENYDVIVKENGLVHPLESKKYEVLDRATLE